MTHESEHRLGAEGAAEEAPGPGESAAFIDPALTGDLDAALRHRQGEQPAAHAYISPRLTSDLSHALRRLFHR